MNAIYKQCSGHARRTKEQAAARHASSASIYIDDFTSPLLHCSALTQAHCAPETPKVKIAHHDIVRRRAVCCCYWLVIKGARTRPSPQSPLRREDGSGPGAGAPQRCGSRTSNISCVAGEGRALVTSLDGNTPPGAGTMASTMQLEFTQAMTDFKTMFPDMDDDVIEAVLRANQGAVDATIDQLLAMSTDNQNERLRLEMERVENCSPSRRKDLIKRISRGAENGDDNDTTALV